MAFQTYKETWHFVVRQRYTGRRKEYQPYYMLSELYKYIRENQHHQILDIGCGENNLRLFFKNIVGIDHTLEADHWAWIHEPEFDTLPHFGAGIAINSLHFGNITENVKKALTKCDKLFITLNENQDIEEQKNLEYWQQYGKVEYFWHGQKIDQLQDIKTHLLNDQLYPYEFGTDKVDNHAEELYNDFVQKDPYYGVIRVVLGK